MEGPAFHAGPGAMVNLVGVEVRTLGFKSPLRHLLVTDLQ